MKLVPGASLYSNIHQYNTLIVSDSITGNIRTKTMKNNIDIAYEDVVVKKYPGATAEEINHYIDYLMDSIQPKQIIIIAGSNDISKEYRNAFPDDNKIVNDIINIADRAKEYGTSKVVISGIMIRRSYFFKDVIERINNMLYDKCQEKGYVFIDQTDIKLKHLSDDGLHLNKLGISILKMNLFRIFFTFNPYLCDFENDYEKAL